MGDFNINTLHGFTPITHSSNLQNLFAKKSLIEILISAGLKEIQQASNSFPRPTWIATRDDHTLQTCIDYIWLSIDLFHDVRGFGISTSEMCARLVAHAIFKKII